MISHVVVDIIDILDIITISAIIMIPLSAVILEYNIVHVK